MGYQFNPMDSGKSSCTLSLDALATSTRPIATQEPGAMVGSVLNLVFLGVVAALLGVGFLLLVEEMPASGMRTHEATPTLPEPPAAAPHEMAPNYSASPAALVSPVSPRPFAAHGQPAEHKGIAFEARLRFLKQQQALLELQLTRPGLSAAETTRLERQKVYWGHAIERMLDSPGPASGSAGDPRNRPR
jgi:hypothetical protein